MASHGSKRRSISGPGQRELRREEYFAQLLGRGRYGGRASRRTWSGTWLRPVAKRWVWNASRRMICAKLCHDSGGELEQIQFLLGHASVQTTERYLGCKQNLGSPVNDRFKLRLDVQPRDVNVESAMVKGSTPETSPCKGIECRDGGHADEQPVEAKRLFQPERTDLVEVRQGQCPHSLRRCSGLGASQSDSENKVNGQRDLGVGGSVGFGTLHD